MSTSTTPSIIRYRKRLRQVISDEYSGVNASSIFDKIVPQGAAFLRFDDLERFCEKIGCPAAALSNVYTPYGVKQQLITKNQWIEFMNEDLPVWTDTRPIGDVDERQTFILSKFVLGFKTKFGRRFWASALAQNPPNSLNTVLHLSALCHLYENMNLPFPVGDFVDSLFAFYGQKIESITLEQFDLLLNFA
jgi:hypothetical protein